MKRTTLLLGTAAALVLCSPAQAAGMYGWYFSLEGGANWVNDLDYDVVGTFPTTHTHFVNIGTDTGWAVLASVGYGFNERWRVELEGGYRDNNAEDFLSVSPTVRSGFTTFTTKTDGDLREFSLMANVMYDVPLTERMSLTLGAGLGADRARFDDDFYGRDSSWNFAYQGIAGLNYAVGERSELFLRYRYFAVPDPSFTYFDAFDHVCCFNFDDIQKHTATVGFRYFFMAPAAEPMMAPPPPPPPQQQPKQFIIFFGWDKCNITPEADRVLSEAASTAKETGSASVQIVGHTDTSGSAAYNQRLSECRANAAKSNLVGKGIAGDQISASGRGETELMVQTGDGVKEPQNRRATIDLQ